MIPLLQVVDNVNKDHLCYIEQPTQAVDLSNVLSILPGLNLQFRAKKCIIFNIHDYMSRLFFNQDQTGL